jgi:hypothetical protein
MRSRKHFIVMAFVAILVFIFAIIGCKQDVSPVSGDIPRVQVPTPRALSFGTNCKVIIKSDDLFTNAEWNTLCDKVVEAINGKYSSAPGSFPTIFASDQNATVVLGNNFTHNWEVKNSEFRTAYIKTTSISTVNFTEIIEHMEANYPGKD